MIQRNGPSPTVQQCNLVYSEENGEGSGRCTATLENGWGDELDCGHWVYWQDPPQMPARREHRGTGGPWTQSSCGVAQDNTPGGSQGQVHGTPQLRRGPGGATFGGPTAAWGSRIETMEAAQG